MLAERKVIGPTKLTPIFMTGQFRPQSTVTTVSMNSSVPVSRMDEFKMRSSDNAREPCIV